MIFLHIIAINTDTRQVIMALRIADVVHETRKNRGLTQEKLAELIGVSAGYIGQIERNETTPSAIIIAKLVDTLGIDANTLFYSSENSASLSREISIRASRLSTKNQEVLLGVINVIEQAYRKL